MAKRIIVISGKQYSGKDTLAQILLKKFTNFKRIGLGDGIKLEYGEQHGLSFDEIEANKAKYRADLQALGMKRRAEDEDYWIKKVIQLPEDMIVPDIRVQKEYDYFKEAGAFKIRVNASAESRSKRGTLVSEDNITETALDNITDWDLVLTNEGTYEDLVKQSDFACEKIKSYFNI